MLVLEAGLDHLLEGAGAGGLDGKAGGWWELAAGFDVLPIDSPSMKCGIAI